MGVVKIVWSIQEHRLMGGVVFQRIVVIDKCYSEMVHVEGVVPIKDNQMTRNHVDLTHVQIDNNSS